MSNSKLVKYTKLSPNCNKPRNKKIRKIVIHHMAGKLSVKTCGDLFARPSTQASSNYGIGNDGTIAMYVEEKNRSWATSSAAVDNEAVTIEVANSKTGGNWPVSDAAMESLIDLCVDICERNDIEELNYTGGKDGNLLMHCWYAATACPGPYLKSKFPYIEKEVNKRLKKKTKTVKATGTADSFAESYAGTYKTTAGLRCRNDAGTGYKTLCIIPKGTKVQCFGYYSKSKSGTRWLYIQFTLDGVQYTGFSSKAYLKKV